MEQEANVKSIRLEDFWIIFRQRFWIIVLAAALMVGSFFAYKTLTFRPQYRATATLYILRQGNEQETSYQSREDFSLALNVVNDCTYLLKSHAVLDEVIEELDLEIDYQDLYYSLSTSNPDDTRILEVYIVSDTPEQAKRIVDSVCEIGAQKIQEAMGFNQVNFYEKGIANRTPCNRTGMRTYCLIGMLTAVLVYVLFLILHLADDRIHDAESITKNLGLSVLGDIPNAYDASGGHSDGYYYGKSKKYEAASTDKKRGKK